MGLSSLLPSPLTPGVSLHGPPLSGPSWGPFSWETSEALSHCGARGIGGLQLCPVCRGGGGPWAGQEIPNRIRFWERRCPLSRQALGESDYDFPPSVTSLPPRGQSSPASAPKGSKSYSPLPENNKPVFHDPFSRRHPRGIEGLSKAGPAASALPRPLPGSPAPATAVRSWGMTSTMTFIHHTEAP